MCRPSGNNSGVSRMLRAIRSVLGAAAVIFGGGLLAQPKDVPAKDAPAKDTQPDNYFPLKLKAKWTYKLGDNFIDVTVVKTEKVGSDDYYQLDTVVGKDPKMSETVFVRT